MTYTLAHKIRLYPNKLQEIYFLKACGTARFSWNWALHQWSEQYSQGLKPSSMTLKKQFNSLKKEQFPWIYEVTKCASEQPFFNLGAAYKNFFKKHAKYPKFKKRGMHDSFYLSNDQFYVDSNKIRIPKLGLVKMAEELRFPEGKIQSAVISKKADKWFVSVSVILESTPVQSENQARIGVDVGLTHLAVLSDGTMIDGPKPLKKNMRKIKVLHRRVSRKVKGSNNRFKARMKLSRQYLKVSDIRSDALHKLSTYLSKNYGFICVEDLNVKGMLKNHSLARSISDMGWGELVRHLEYKSNLYGSKVIKADRFYASSKTCSCCGNVKKDLKLSDRVYRCDVCGMNMDRDLNASKNLEQNFKDTLGYRGIKVCGDRKSQGPSDPVPVEETETYICLNT